SRRRHTRFSRDWSSDVCSSDLIGWRDADAAGQLDDGGDVLHLGVRTGGGAWRVFNDRTADADLVAHLHRADVGGGGEDEQAVREIGRASCRERVEKGGEGGTCV